MQQNECNKVNLMLAINIILLDFGESAGSSMLSVAASRDTDGYRFSNEKLLTF